MPKHFYRRSRSRCEFARLELQATSSSTCCGRRKMLRGCEVPANRDGSQVIDLRPVRARSHDFAVPVELCCGAAAGAAGEVRFALCRTTREGERAASECRGTGAAAVLMLRGVCHSLGSAYEQRMKLLPKGRGVVVTYTGGISATRSSGRRRRTRCSATAARSRGAPRQPDVRVREASGSRRRRRAREPLLHESSAMAEPRDDVMRVRRGRRAGVRASARTAPACSTARRAASSSPADRSGCVRVRARPEPCRRLHATRRRRRRRGRARRRCRRRVVCEVGAPPRRNAAPTAPCGAREAGVVRAF